MIKEFFIPQDTIIITRHVIFLTLKAFLHGNKMNIKLFLSFLFSYINKADNNFCYSIS
jgi:hypothetical protein